MPLSIRDKVLGLLKESKNSLSSKEIAERLKLKRKQTQDAIVNLKKQKKVIRDNKDPSCVFYNEEYISPQRKKLIPKSKDPCKKFRFNKYVILYSVQDSIKLKMLNDLNSLEELSIAYTELQGLKNVVDIAAFKKIEIKE